MKRLAEFTKTTLIGGMLVVLPLCLSVLLLYKFVELLEAALEPVAHHVPVRPALQSLLVLAAAIGICFLAGLVVRTGPGKWVKRAMERRLLERIPGYAMIRGVAERFVGQGDGHSFAPALVELEESLVPAFVVDRHADGRFTIFVPAVPTPATGSLYIMEPAKVHLIDVPFHKVLTVISHWGVGSQELLAALKDPRAGLTKSPPAVQE